MRGGRIFISYRHADSAADARSIFTELREHFGDERVFQDIRNLPKGEDFKAALKAILDQTAIVVAVIGPTWLTLADEHGKRRLDRDDDLVRQELATALERGIPIIPVLVGGAALPRQDELPEDISRLTSYLGTHVSHANFTSDISTLVQALEARVGGAPVARSASRALRRARDTFDAIPRWGRVLIWALGLLGLVALLNPGIGAQADAALRVATHAGNDVPLSHATTERIHALLPRPTNPSCRDFEQLADGVLWGAAQSYVACGAPPVAFASFQAAADRLLDDDCRCWPIGGGGQGSGYYADFWVMEAYSANGVAIPANVMARIIQSQTADGWWPIHSRQVAQPADAALYFAALMVIALRKQAPLAADDETREQILAAIARAKDWLAANEPTPGEEWSDYPNNDRRVSNHLFGGMVLTALSDERASERFRRLATNWSGKLELPSASLYVGSDALVQTSRTGHSLVFGDIYRHVPFSWEICGVAASWPALSYAEKIDALIKVERSIRRESTRSDPFGRPWVRDEVGYCLAQLEHADRAS